MRKEDGFKEFFCINLALNGKQKEGKESSTLEHALFAIELWGNMIVLAFVFSSAEWLVGWAVDGSTVN